MSDRVAVVGSLNGDVVLRVERLPGPGETVLGWDVARYRGGKGANQAVAAARLGRPVAMIGRVGADHEGTGCLRALVEEGVDVSWVSVDAEVPTGHATITVDDRGENSIVVIPGANGRLSSAEVEGAAAVLRDAAVTLAQLEVPMDAVGAAARMAGGVFVLNAAPGRPLPAEVMERTEILVVNRAELAHLIGDRPAVSLTEVEEQIGRVGRAGAVVVTLGGEGAAVWSVGRLTVIPAPAVEIVDTTGAGDAFCGGLADAIARGEPLLDAAAWAVAVGAVATTRHGAQTALPTPDQVAALRGD